MNKKDIVQLFTTMATFGVVSGIFHAIFSPEPTLERAIGYAVFSGIFSGGIFYFLDKYVLSKR